MPLLFIHPCSPISAKTVPAGDAWLHEPKLDGYRLQIVKEGRQVRLYSRRGNEWTRRLPGLVDELAGIPCRSAIIDAELCLPGAGGVPVFYGLHLRMRRRRSELMIYAFDLLHRDGRDLHALPLTERRRRLERLRTESIRELRIEFPPALVGWPASADPHRLRKPTLFLFRCGTRVRLSEFGHALGLPSAGGSNRRTKAARPATSPRRSGWLM